MVEIISTEQAPAAIGPYSQAVKSGNLVFCSGQLGINPATKTMAEGVEQQTLQIFNNLRAVLHAAGCTLTDVVKTTVFLADMADFPTVNKIYAEQFGDHKPARATVQVAHLPLDGQIEIECIAVGK
jgi:2-iminobutanoate/2-iminopropanoate deaminase